jgi:hypothetical protein
MDWVNPWIGLGWVRNFWILVGWVEEVMGWVGLQNLNPWLCPLLLFSSCGICSSVRPAVRRFKSIQSSFWRISCSAHSAVCLPRPCAHYTDQSSNDVCKPTVLSSVHSATAYISDIQSAQYANRTLLEVPRDKARR